MEVPLDLATGCAQLELISRHQDFKLRQLVCYYALGMSLQSTTSIWLL